MVLLRHKDILVHGRLLGANAFPALFIVIFFTLPNGPSFKCYSVGVSKEIFDKFTKGAKRTALKKIFIEIKGQVHPSGLHPILSAIDYTLFLYA